MPEDARIDPPTAVKSEVSSAKVVLPISRLASIRPHLPDHVRAAILALAEGARPLDEGR
jgi:hypothetical protein